MKLFDGNFIQIVLLTFQAHHVLFNIYPYARFQFNIFTTQNYKMKRKPSHFLFSIYRHSVYYSTPSNSSSFSIQKITHRKLRRTATILSTNILVQRFKCCPVLTQTRNFVKGIARVLYWNGSYYNQEVSIVEESFSIRCVCKHVNQITTVGASDTKLTKTISRW